MNYQLYFKSKVFEKSFNPMEHIYLTLKLIKKCYKDGILLDEDITIIMKFIMTTSLFTTIFTDFIDRGGKIVKNLFNLYLFLEYITSVFGISNDVEEKIDDQISNNVTTNTNNDMLLGELNNIDDNDEERIKIENENSKPIIDKKNESINKMMSETIDFFNEKILINSTNIALIYGSSKFLMLLELLKIDILNPTNKMKIIKSVLKVYGTNFTIDLFKYLMKNICDCFINITNKNTIMEKYLSSNRLNNSVIFDKELMINDIKLLDNYINLFRAGIQAEKEMNQTDPYNIKHGFVFNDTVKSGITLGPIVQFPKKGYTIIFSFKWTPDFTNIKHRMNLIALVLDKESGKMYTPKDEQLKKDDFKDHTQLSIYIEEGHLIIQLKDKIDTGVIIRPYQTNVVIISQQEPGFFCKRQIKNMCNCK